MGCYYSTAGRRKGKDLRIRAERLSFDKQFCRGVQSKEIAVCTGRTYYSPTAGFP